MKLLNHEFEGSTIHYYFEDNIELVVYEWGNGAKFWYQMGDYHRLDGPAIEWEDGTKKWYQMGKLHRLDGPACEYADGSKHWCQMGKLHRLDGPAIERADSSKEWFIEGTYYSEQNFYQKVKELK